MIRQREQSEENAFKYWRQRRPVFILVSGLAGTGKTTSAKYIKVQLDNAEIFPFAFGVKTAAAESFGWDGVKDQRGRRLLQGVGGIGREYDENIWVSQVFDRAIESGYNYIICDDWRFPNELKYLKGIEDILVVTIRIDAPNREILKNTPEYFDISETSLPKVGDIYDHTIDNTGSFESLFSTLDYVIKETKRKLMED